MPKEKFFGLKVQSKFRQLEGPTIIDPKAAHFPK
jgi:hypothetical protein